MLSRLYCRNRVTPFACNGWGYLTTGAVASHVALLWDVLTLCGGNSLSFIGASAVQANGGPGARLTGQQLSCRRSCANQPRGNRTQLAPARRSSSLRLVSAEHGPDSQTHFCGLKGMAPPGTKELGRS